MRILQNQVKSNIMGDFNVRKIATAKDRSLMYQKALNDIDTFEKMLKKGVFDNGNPKIGAEQELCIVDKHYNPATSALQLLNMIRDKHYTNELALFNLEINLDPLPLSGGCFSEMEGELLRLLIKGCEIAHHHDAHILMAGILPTLKYRHLQFEYMTPIQRYKTISQTLSELRGSHFEIHLQGVDEIIMSLGSVLFEACNTSFQLHLQIAPSEFVDKYNWAQMIAGPVLSACVNSPILFGNELWAETRIALFKQSLDTRSAEKLLRHQLPRVYFGSDWLHNSPAELWKNDLIRFPLLVTSDDFEDAKTVFENGQIPNLRAIRLHNGTTYTWNRMCYGDDKQKPHLRIECRYLPSGPTIVDEIANFAFWIGLMNCEPPNGAEFWKNVDFKYAKNNFIKAARTGLDTVFQWFGQNIPAKNLILETLLPMAKEGLRKQNVSENDIEYYLSVFEKRVQNEVTGASWTVHNFRNLSKKYGQVIAEKEITRQMLAYQKENRPLHEWQNIDINNCLSNSYLPTIEQQMTQDIFCIHENDSLELVEKILQWKNIHHLPIEDYNGNLVGMITDKIMQKTKKENPTLDGYARDIMTTDLLTIEADATVEAAIETMKKHDLTYLPVVFNHKLVGIFTENDLKK